MRKNWNRILASTCSAVILTVFAACQKKEMPPEVAGLLRQTVEAPTLPASIQDQKERMKVWEEMRRFYANRQYQPAWSGPEGPLPRAAELIQAIQPLAEDGIAPRRYQRDRLEALRQEVEKTGSLDDPQAQRRLVDLDVELTNTFLTLASHLATGRLQPETVQVEWYTKPRNVDLDARLETALAQDGDLVKALRSFTPPHEDYGRLLTALARHREIAVQGGWPVVPAGPDLKPGDRGARVQALKARLAATGELQPAPAGQAQVDLYDEAVAAAVTRFQQRHGLETTGKVGAETLAELNVSALDRIRQIQVNLERWRWMPASLGERYILVNVPEFRLDVVDGGKTAMTMRVVVGKDQSRTPAFSDKMTYLELNPAWNLPDSIATEEVLPKLAGNPGYLASHNMDVVQGWGENEQVVDASQVDVSTIGQPGSQYRLRQRPGADNPLGKVKFMFPNQFNVYLHDTPADHLFNRAERDFSHGCIRLEKPVELAELLLRGDPKWSPQALQAALASGEQAAIPLAKPLPVHILYWTAWVEKDGTVQFRKDVYGHDATLEKALADEPPVWVEPAAGEVRAALE